MNRRARIYVAGHRGLVGSALVRELSRAGYDNLLLRSHHELDLRSQSAVDTFFAEQRPEYVFLAAAKVGGILANATRPADFIYDNLTIATNVIRASAATGVRKLLNLGSSCIYPRMAPQPIPESALLDGPLEPTNRAYAIAKIAAIELCDAFRAQEGCNFVSAMPTNLYGPGDNFDRETSHVIPAMIQAFEYARTTRRTVRLWGTGNALRDFLYVDDLARACMLIMEHFSEPGPINVGSGSEITIRELATTVSRITGFSGFIEWDSEKPDGTPRKILETSRMRSLGWSPTTPLEDGLAQTVRWFRGRL